MRVIRIRPIAARLAGVVLAAAALLAGTAPGMAGAAMSSPAQHATPAVPVLVGCGGILQVRPRLHKLGCADGNDNWTKMTWSRWSTEALGTGIERMNTCVPDCADGHIKPYHVIIVLWRARALAHPAGTTAYSQATVIYTSKIPAHLPRSRTIALLLH
jgi:hypothetical protein